MLPQGSHRESSHRGSHITRKRGVYYYRRRLPAPDNREIAVSLGTTNYREAEHRARLLDDAFNAARETMTSSTDLQATLRDYLRTTLEIDADYRLKAPAGKPLYAGPRDNEDPVDVDLDIIDELLSRARESLARREYKSVAATVAALMQESGLGKEHERALAHGVLSANVQAYEAMRRRVLGRPDIAEAPAPTTAVAPVAPPKGPLLSEFVPTFVEFMTTEGGWRGQTQAQSNTTYRMFIAWCSDKHVESYTRDDTASFYDMLRKLPALYSKDRRWASLTLAQTVEKSAGVDVPRLTMKTIKRHFSALGRLFKRARRLGVYTGENPAHGFEFPNKRKGGAKRSMWEGELLTKLFVSPVWTGCHPFYRYRPGPEVTLDERYWLPILGLYHGNRLEEFAQLRREDVQREGDIWFFDITDEGERQLKNEQSKRRVPIHPKVIALGFLGYVEMAAPNPDDRVFPQLKPGGPDRKLGFYFTKWFTPYRRNVGVYRAGLDYHSFRHGVTTKLFAAGVSRVIVDELTGHEGEGTSQTEYYRGSPLPVLLEAISKVDWPEVNVSATT